ncbi:MAG: tetratricopeptide repeat protein [bacterium]
MVLLLVAVPAAATSAPISAQTTAQSAEGSTGTHLQAPLAAMLQEPTGDAQPIPGFSLTAQHMRIEVDSADVSIHATGNPKDVNPTTQSSEYTDATLQGTTTRNNFRWNVFAMDGAPVPIVEATCRSARASDAATLERVPYVNAARQATTRKIDLSVAWSECNGVAQITGSFGLSLWQWNATLTANGRTQDIRTGPQQSPLVPAGAPDISQVFGRDAEAYVYVTGGKLTVPLGALPPILLTTGDAALSTTGLTLEAAVGNLEVGDASTPLSGNHVTISGDVGAHLAGRGTSLPMAATLSGDGEAVVDGHPVSPSGASASPMAWLLWPVAALIGSAVLGGPTIYFGRRRFVIHRRRPGRDPVAQAKGREYQEAAYEAINQRRFPEALRLVDKALDFDAADSESTFIRGLCLAGLGRLPEALLMHTEADLWLQQEAQLGMDVAPLRAENAYEGARCCARLSGDGQIEKAAQWLRLAITLQDSFAADAATDAALATVLDKVRGDKNWWLQP